MAEVELLQGPLADSPEPFPTCLPMVNADADADDHPAPAIRNRGK